MATQDAIFIAEIARRFDDDQPRLEYATWLRGIDPARAELIAIQCNLAASERFDPYGNPYESYSLRVREGSLLQANKARWLRPVEVTGFSPDEFQFCRGMIESVSIEDDYFLNHAHRLIHPSLPLLCRLKLYQTGDSFPVALAQHPLMSQLRHLNLQDTHPTDQDVERLLSSGRSSELRELVVGCPESPPPDDSTPNPTLGLRAANAIVTSPMLSKLQSLCLRNSRAGDPLLCAIGKSPLLSRIVSLDLAHCQVTDIGVRSFARAAANTCLEVLCLGGNVEVTDAGMPDLLESLPDQHLRVLNLSFTGIGNNTLHALTRRPIRSLRALHFEGLRTDQSGIQLLASSPAFTSLHHLNLRAATMSAAAIESVFVSTTLQSLQALTLDHVAIGDNLSGLLSSCNLTRLSQLSLIGCQIGDRGAKAIAASPFSSRLSMLNLYWNPISAIGVQALLESPYLSDLQYLGLKTDGLPEVVREGIRSRFGY